MKNVKQGEHVSAEIHYFQENFHFQPGNQFYIKKKEEDTYPAHRSNCYTLLVKGMIKDNS